jgi:hypothetical protein
MQMPMPMQQYASYAPQNAGVAVDTHLEAVIFVVLSCVLEWNAVPLAELDAE